MSEPKGSSAQGSLATANISDGGPALLWSVLDAAHPLMVEAFYIAALPHWYNLPLFAAIRDKDDGRDQGLVERLIPYSFITPLAEGGRGEPAYAVRGQERDALHRRWIAENPKAYREAHHRALAYIRKHRDPNHYAQSQNELYHLLLVDPVGGADLLASLVRAYRREHTLTALDRLMDTAREAAFYLSLLDGDSAANLFFQARLAQLSGDWSEGKDLLAKLSQKGEWLSARLVPYVTRAEGTARALQGNYVEAIRLYREAYRQFGRLLSSKRRAGALLVEQGYTLIALGDADLHLAESVGGFQEREAARPGPWRWLHTIFYFVVNLPLIVYLSFTLGRRVWNPQFWPLLVGVDWILARLVSLTVGAYRHADALLEAHGEPSERWLADEKLVYVFLKVGDGVQARRLSQMLLDQAEAPLGPYRQAVVQVDLAEANLQLRQPEEAVALLRSALAVFEAYEDQELKARAAELLGQALLATADQEEALGCLEMASAHYQQKGEWIRATRLAEHLKAWLNSAGGQATSAPRERAQALTDGLKHRHYPGRYRHRWLVVFRQVTLTLLPFALLLGPLLTIRLDSSTTLTPQIEFRPKPILDPNVVVSAQISKGIVAHSEIYQVVVSDLALRLTFGFVLLYLVSSLLVGLAAVAFTPLRSVQEGGRAATVCLDEERIAQGEAEGEALEALRGPPGPGTRVNAVLWTGAAEFVQAGVYLWSQSLRDSSRFGLSAGQEPLVIDGHTAWYDSLRDRVKDRVRGGARLVNLDFDVLRSALGLLYLLNLAGIIALALMALFIKRIPAVYGLPGTGFVVDLYPFFYLALVIGPLWWGVVQPLRRRLYLHPHSRLPLGVLAAGLVLTLIQALLRFRPVLTVINLYVPLATILLCASGALAVWRAQVAGKKVFRTPLRVGGALLAGLACVLMLTVIVRDVVAYYHLVQGNVLTTRALRFEQGAAEQIIGDRAFAAYIRAERIGSEPVWGLDTRPAARLHLEYPPSARLPWLSAQAGEAAWRARRGDLVEAGQIYSETLEYTDRPDEVYAAQAVARFGLAAQQWGGQGLQVAAGPNLQGLPREYKLGLDDLDQAIKLRPDKASYQLWRAVAYHALGSQQDCGGVGQLNPLVGATYSYTMALSLEARDPEFTSVQREHAWTGLGWILYLCGNYEPALASFQRAREASPHSAGARLAEGYALYALEQFVEAQTVWEEAMALEPKDPTGLLALATLHWRLGGSAGRALGLDSCTEYQAALDLFSQAADRDKLWPQTDKDVGFTRRTMGQILYLLAVCPGYTRVGAYQDAIAQYTQALALDPGNSAYLHRRAVFAYGLYTMQLNGSPVHAYRSLLEAIDDASQAAEISPDNATYTRDRNSFANEATNLATTKGPAAAASAFRALAGFEEARRDSAAYQDTEYTPSQWFSVIRSEAIDRNLANGDRLLEARDTAAALDYYLLVAEYAPLNARAAFGVGLVSLLEGEREQALDWYRQGLERVRITGKTQTARDALRGLQVQAAAAGLEIQPIVDLFKRYGFEPQAPDAASAFEAGLAALRLGRPDEAIDSYRQGLDLARLAGDSSSPQDARAALYRSVLEDESLPAGDILALFDLRGVVLEPATAQAAFELAPAGLALGDQAEAARLSNLGIELAAAAQDIKVVRQGAFTLRDYLLAHPELDRLEAYWPLHDDLVAREQAVKALPRRDLYWAYRAELGYRLLRDRQLMRQQSLHDEVYEQIFSSIIADIERAYALNPAEHKVTRDFFVDSNVGWLYMRRGDDYSELGNYVQALADYEKAAARIRAASVNAALDRTEDLFKAGLTALRLGQLEQGADWYGQGIALVQERGAEFGLKKQVGPAIEALQALVAEKPELGAVAGPILERLEAENR